MRGMSAPGAKKSEAEQTHAAAHASKKPQAADATAAAKKSADIHQEMGQPELGHLQEHLHPPPHGHPHYISVKLHDVSQLFNSMDPSPFIEKDLDDDAEEFIVSWAQEYAPDAPVRLRVYLEQWPSEDPREMVKTAVHNHFAHRTELTRLELRRLLKQGRESLLIGLVFLSACLVASQMLLGHDDGTWAEIVRESLTIAGWVAMWKPMQIYLYDWWPVRRRERVFAKLSHMPVEVLQRGGG
jgi:hypothetical protein